LLCSEEGAKGRLSELLRGSALLNRRLNLLSDLLSDLLSAPPHNVAVYEGRIAIPKDVRAQASLGDCHLLVDRPEPGALRIKGWVEQVSVGQSLVERLGARRTANPANCEKGEKGCSHPSTQQPRHYWAALVAPAHDKAHLWSPTS